MAKANRKGQAAVLTVEQIKDVWAELSQPHRLIAQLLYLTASRVGEIVSLRAEDIAGGEILISQPKVKKIKRVKITADIQAALSAVDLPKSGYLFPSNNKAGYLTARGFEKRLSAAFDLLGIEGASTHSFRRSAATHTYKKTGSLATTARLTGHASLGALSLYIDVDGEAADEAIASTFAGMVA